MSNSKNTTIENMPKKPDRGIILKFKTVNVDGEIKEWGFKYIEDMLKNWLSDDCTLPANDDKVIFAEFNGEKIEAEIFEDIINEFRR